MGRPWTIHSSTRRGTCNSGAAGNCGVERDPRHTRNRRGYQAQQPGGGRRGGSMHLHLRQGMAALQHRGTSRFLVCNKRATSDLRPQKALAAHRPALRSPRARFPLLCALCFLRWQWQYYRYRYWRMSVSIDGYTWPSPPIPFGCERSQARQEDGAVPPEKQPENPWRLR